MATIFPFKVASSRGGICTPSNTSFLEPTRVNILNGILISSAVFSGLTIVTDKQTLNHATPSVATGCINAVLRCSLITRNTGTVHTSAKAVLPVSRSVSVTGSPPKFNHLFTSPLPTFPKSFMQIRSEIFAQSC